MDAWGTEALLDPVFEFYIFDNSCTTGGLGRRAIKPATRWWRNRMDL